MKCPYHLCNNLITGKQRKFCSSQCKNKFYVNQRRRVNKEIAVKYKGGQCEKCGYSKSIWALEFHHLDSKTKDFGISDGKTRGWEENKKELDKCVLMCANCHREAHHNNGM